MKKPTLSPDILPEILREMAKIALEAVMQAEREVFLAEHGGTKNGHYTRNLDTSLGRLEGLRVPRDREGRFHTQLWAPYQRRALDLEQLISSMFMQGLSVRRIAEVLETVLHMSYSPATLSRIAEITREEIQAWRERPLPRGYAILMVDALFVPVRRDTVAKEAVLVVLGITEGGRRELLDFEVAPAESAQGWHALFQRLYRRGLREVLLVVGDGLTGLEEAVKAVFPRADFQRCTVHQLRNTRHQVRRKDWEAIRQDLKAMLDAPDLETALAHWAAFREQWQARYPKVVASWEQNLDQLLTFLRYPKAIRTVIRSTNLLERTFKELRRRFKVVEVFPSVAALERMTYWHLARLNARWDGRSLRGFREAQEDLRRMFAQRYPPLTQKS